MEMAGREKPRKKLGNKTHANTAAVNIHNVC